MTIDQIKQIIEAGAAAENYLEKNSYNLGNPDYPQYQREKYDFGSSCNDVQDKRAALEKYKHFRTFFIEKILIDGKITLDEFRDSLINRTEGKTRERLSKKLDNMKKSCGVAEDARRRIITEITCDLFDSQGSDTVVTAFLRNEKKVVNAVPQQGAPGVNAGPRQGAQGVNAGPRQGAQGVNAVPQQNVQVKQLGAERFNAVSKSALAYNGPKTDFTKKYPHLDENAELTQQEKDDFGKLVMFFRETKEKKHFKDSLSLLEQEAGKEMKVLKDAHLAKFKFDQLRLAYTELFKVMFETKAAMLNFILGQVEEGELSDSGKAVRNKLVNAQSDRSKDIKFITETILRADVDGNGAFLDAFRNAAGKLTKKQVRDAVFNMNKLEKNVFPDEIKDLDERTLHPAEKLIENYKNGLESAKGGIKEEDQDQDLLKSLETFNTLFTKPDIDYYKEEYFVGEYAQKVIDNQARTDRTGYMGQEYDRFFANAPGDPKTGMAGIAESNAADAIEQTKFEISQEKADGYVQLMKGVAELSGVNDNDPILNDGTANNAEKRLIDTAGKIQGGLAAGDHSKLKEDINSYVKLQRGFEKLLNDTSKVNMFLILKKKKL